MSENKKERAMTEKGFLHKASGKVAAAGFLAAHRVFLATGKLAELTGPILEKMDKGELFPTNALEEIKGVVLGHMLAQETLKHEERLNKVAAVKTPKNWLATIYTADGNIATRKKEDGEEVLLQQQFDHMQEADRWVDRRLVEGECDWFGVVHHNTQTNKDGDPLSFTILRDSAFSRIFGRQPGKAGVVMHQNKTAGKLSWGAKSRPTKVTFSHG